MRDVLGAGVAGLGAAGGTGRAEGGEVGPGPEGSGDALPLQTPPAPGPPAAPSGASFRDPKGRFSLRLPPGWGPPPKAKRGADAYFIDSESKYNNLGVTASRARIDSVEEFGSLEAAGEKLLAAERAKDSVQSADLLGQSARRGESSGVQFYDFTYTVVTSYGPKQVQCSVGVAGRTLYIVNGQVFCKEGACEGPKVSQLRRAIQSFDVDASG